MNREFIIPEMEIIVLNNIDLIRTSSEQVDADGILTHDADDWYI